MGAPQYEQAGADIAGTGTVNTIPRWTGASTLGDSRLIDNRTVVTTTRRFDVDNASGIRVQAAGDPTQFIRISQSGAQSLIDALATNGTLRFRVNAGGTDAILAAASGNVGVGVTPLASLAGYRSIEIGGQGSGMFSSGLDTYLTANAAYYSAGWKYAATGPANTIQLNNGAIVFNRAASGSAGGAITWLESARIDSSGRLGVGNTSPGSYNSSFNQIVVGNETPVSNNGITISSSSQSTLAFANGTAGAAAYRGYLQYTYSSNVLAVGVNGVAVASFGTGSLDVSTAGYGLKLPATNGTTYNTDPNTLDCYAEKDLTATVTCGTSGTITLSTSTLKFTRIGRVVHIYGRLVVQSVSSPTGRFIINTGLGANELPAVSTTGASWANAFAVGLTTAPMASMSAGDGKVYFDRWGGAGGVYVDVASFAVANAELFISIHYTV